MTRESGELPQPRCVPTERCRAQHRKRRGMAEHDHDNGQGELRQTDPEPVVNTCGESNARTTDARNAFYRQLTTVSDRMAELQAIFRENAHASAVLVAAKLNFDWSLLDAQLELSVGLMQADGDAGCDLWGLLAAMGVACTRLRILLEHGTAYQRQTEAPSGFLAQLHQLSAKLRVGNQVASAVADGSSLTRDCMASAETDTARSRRDGPRSVPVDVVDLSLSIAQRGCAARSYLGRRQRRAGQRAVRRKELP